MSGAVEAVAVQVDAGHVVVNVQRSATERHWLDVVVGASVEQPSHLEPATRTPVVSHDRVVFVLLSVLHVVAELLLVRLHEPHLARELERAGKRCPSELGSNESCRAIQNLRRNV